MSGIVGIYNRDGQPCKRDYLEGMTDAIAHRGPDGYEIWREKNVGFGHRMLLTTPESLVETLPLVGQGENGCLVLTADARIDNREELLQEFQLTSSEENPITDSQIVLAAYQKWGIVCPEYLIGDFAFAIWDEQNQQVFCARDHFGVKPFYYYVSERTFVFASELKAILTVPGIPKEINQVRLGDFLSLEMEDQVTTSYRDLVRLPPAHWMIISRHALHTEQYWQLNPDHEIQLESDEAYAKQFRTFLAEAVRCRLRSAFPIGSSLSGGLDSSSITVMARSLLTDETALHTFSFIFNDLPSCDERPYIDAVLKQGNFTPHFLRGDHIGPLSDIDTILDYEDEALSGPTYYLPWHLNRWAKQEGIKVLLGGHDGDTVVSHGIYRLTELAQQHQWEELVLEAKAISQRMGSSAEKLLFLHSEMTLRQLSQRLQWIPLIKAFRAFHRYLGLSRKRLLWQIGLRPLLQFWLSWLPIARQSSSEFSRSFINPNFVRQISNDFQHQKAEEIQSELLSRKQPETVREHHWQSLTSGIFSYTLEQFDQCAAAHGIEARHPFLDKRLVEFCLAIPSTQKMSNGWGRLVMRRAMEGLLPADVQWRGNKADLTPNFIHGLLNINRDYLDSEIAQLRDMQTYLNVDFVQDIYRKMASEQNTTAQERMVFWQSIIIRLWLQRRLAFSTIYSCDPVFSAQVESDASLVECIKNSCLETINS